MAGVTGALTFGAPLMSSILVNMGGAVVSSSNSQQNPNSGMAGAAPGTAAGYWSGGAIEGSLNAQVNPWYRPLWHDWTRDFRSCSSK